MGVSVDILAPEWVKGAFETERGSLSTAWSEAQIAACARGEGAAEYLVLHEGERVLGIASFTVAAGECDIINLAVEKGSRRKGCGTLLLQSVFERARGKGAGKCFLEVAEGNLAAASLYKKSGFAAVGRRKGFYRGEDALVMEKDL